MDDEMLDLENDIIEISDEDGNVFSFVVYDYFYYNGEEYAILRDAEEAKAEEETDANISVVIMKVNPFVDENGEEMEEFVPIEGSLMDELSKVARNRILEGMEAEPDGEEE